MSDPIQKALNVSIAALLRPLVRLLLRHGIAYGSFAEIAKRVYVDVAEHDFTLDKRKQTNSRIAVLTGLTRKDVLRILREAESASPPEQKHHRASRVISGWLNDAEFQDADGNPELLTFEGERRSFSLLVSRYSGDMPVRAMADELRRVGAISVLDDGLLKLETTAYIPSAASPETLAMFGGDVADLMSTVDYNVDPAHSDTRLQLQTYYDNLSIEDAEAFAKWADPQSIALLRRFDKWLAQRDRDNQDVSSQNIVNGTGRSRTGVGIYLFREDIENTNEKK